MRPAAINSFTAAQVTSLIRDPNAVVMTSGLQLLDTTLSVLDDVSDSLAGGSVGRDNYATLHGHADLSITKDLDWGTALVRPYVTLSNGTITVPFNLGAYLTSSPETDVDETPITHSVQCYDIIHWLNTPVGEAYTVEAGTGYLAAAENIVVTQGLSAYQIDQTQAAQTLPSSRVWAFDDRTTWLNIVNDLLAAVGYMGLWSDWDGRLRMVPYQVPSDRMTEWLYDDNPVTSTLATAGRKITRDWFDAPNRWVFYWSKDPSTAAPVLGNGIYVFVNDRNGPTSVQARGRIITAQPQQVDAVDQNALIAAASARIDADLRLKTQFTASTFPNPLHWHFDKVTLGTPTLGPIQDVQNLSWTLPLNGDDMTHVWALI